MERIAVGGDHSIIYKALKLVVLVLIVVSIWLVIKNISSVAPSNIVIDAQNLSQSQYNELVAKTLPYQSENFFKAPLPTIRNTVLDTDWVSQAKVERDWQQGLVITAQPRVAVARFGSEHLIDAEGHVFVPSDATELSNKELVTLQGARSQSVLIMQNMQKINEWFAPTRIKVQDLILTPRMTWLIRFDNGMRIIVDNENTTQKLSNLSYLMTNQLQPVASDIASIDLRYKNGFAVTWRPQVAPI